MNILITGAGGFIGSALDKHLSKQHNIYRVIRESSGDSSPATIVMDLTNVNAVKNALAIILPLSVKFDVIIHCAAILATDENRNDMNVFHANNRITENVIFLAKELAVEKIINLSTIGVYPNADGRYNELSPVHPGVNTECLYSLSKFCSEELFFYLLKDTAVINLRLSQVYGNGMRNDRIYSIMKNELEKSNRITVWGNGERVSNFMSVDFLLGTIDRILVSRNIEGTFNVGEENITYLQLAEKIIKEAGNTTAQIIRENKGVRAKVEIDCTKIEKQLENNAG